MFAYVGDNTLTDYEMGIEVAFSSSTVISGHVKVGFRCDNYVSSRVDTDESMIGYFLEISQYTIKLVKHQFGNGITFASKTLSNKINTFQKYRIIVKDNHIVVYRGTLLVFDVVDTYAFSAGRLAFGSSNTAGLIRNLSVKEAE